MGRVANKLRRDVLDKVVFRGAQAKQWRDAKTQVVWHDTRARRPGLSHAETPLRGAARLVDSRPALRAGEARGKVPVHLAVNGHEPEGKAAAYKQLRCINLAKRGIISLNVEWFGIGQLRTDLATSGYRSQRYPAEGSSMAR